MKAPAFWQHDGVLAHLLAPLGCLYAAGGAVHRSMTSPVIADIPVICVGNLVAGGAGKTPIVISIARILSSWGLAPGLLSRGYGGSLSGPLKVDPSQHSAAQVGDEPLLLAQVAPSWISANRVAGVTSMRAAGIDVAVLDDGFQNPGLVKSLSLLVVDGTQGFGNGRVMPAGPLREPVAAALVRAQALVILGADTSGAADRVAGSLPVLGASLEPSTGHELQGRRVLAFAGIGRPAKFFATLKEAGADVVEEMSFADHHPYAERELADLLARAEKLNAIAVTTAKDHVRLPEAAKARVEILPVDLVWSDAEAIETLLKSAVKSVMAHGAE